MKIGFIGDIVGRPARNMIKDFLPNLKGEFGLDFVIANCENASHGFGITQKNSQELLSFGIDCLTGGNHSFDKAADVGVVFLDSRVLRPANVQAKHGKGVGVYDVNGEKLAVINLMGNFAMPECDNPFNLANTLVEELKGEGINNIFIDFHAEATSEKAVLFAMQQGKCSAICGTHTHVGTDDLQIVNGTFFVSDVGLSGCFDGVIGMDVKNPIKKATLGTGKHFDVPKNCQAILQMVIIELDNGVAIDGLKIKIKDNGTRQLLSLW